MWQVAAAIAAPVIGGMISGRSASSAAKTQANAANDAAALQAQTARETNALQERMYNEEVARNEPGRQIGLNALTQLSGMTGAQRPTGFREDPGYRFALQEGQDAMNRQASASGMRLSGSALMDQGRYATGMADQAYGNWWNRETGLNTDAFNRTAAVAGVGQVANQAIGSAGQNFAGSVGNTNMNMAGNVGNALIQGGNARASGYQGQANAFNNALGGIGTGLGMAQAGFFGQNPGFGITPSGNPYGGQALPNIQNTMRGLNFG